MLKRLRENKRRVNIDIWEERPHKPLQKFRSVNYEFKNRREEL